LQNSNIATNLYCESNSVAVSLKTSKQVWEDYAELDPTYAILIDPQFKFNKWNLDTFFDTGKQEIEKVMEKARKMGYPSGRQIALDFGCGIGRLTRALTKHFDKVYGVDISATMINKAEELNKGFPQCEFKTNNKPDLKIFPDQYFDLIYSNLVLQHISERSIIENYVLDLCRTLRKDGLLIFQLPDHIPLAQRLSQNYLKPRSRLFSLFSLLGVDKAYLYTHGLGPSIIMNYIPKNQMLSLLASIDTKVLDLEIAQNSVTYYVTK